MSFVAFMLKRPYTVISGLILIALLGVGAVVAYAHRCECHG
jgi:hypothetical protein